MEPIVNENNSVYSNMIQPLFDEAGLKIIEIKSGLKENDEKFYECIKTIQQDLSSMWKEMSERNSEEAKEIKWKYAAIVFDRLFFYMSLVYTFITFITFVMTVKNLYRPS